jgi:hypothetical protein
MTVTIKLPFETVTCSRCGGSGKFSFNLMHGDMCYGCSGSGVKYTKRGLAAKQFFTESLSKPCEQVVAGDKVRIDTKKFHIVTRTEFGNTKVMAENSPLGGWHYHLDKDMVRIEIGNTVHTMLPGTLVRMMHDDAAKAVKIEIAMAYQETLTKAGTVSKKGKNIFKNPLTN